MNALMRSLCASLVVFTACHGSSTELPASDHSTPKASLDTRTAVPLTATMATHQKQEMRDHLRVVQEIAAALAKDDFVAIDSSAKRIAWSEQQAAMCKHMGAGAPGFAAMGETFHKTADQIGVAARNRDHSAVAIALDATLRTCVGCHDTYRQEIVDEAKSAIVGGPAGMPADCPMHKN